MPIGIGGGSGGGGGGGGGTVTGSGTVGRLAKWTTTTQLGSGTAGTDYVAPAGDGSGLTGLSASALASGTVPAARLGASGVTAGSYLGADITVDAQGRVTLAADGAGAGRPSFGTNVFDPRDYGATVNNLGVDNAVALQAALDAGVDSAALTTGVQNGTPAALFLPAGKWAVKSPIFVDIDRTTLFGPPAGNAPAGEIVTFGGNYTFAPVWVGVKRLEPWSPSSPQGVAGYPTTFATNHRSTLDGEAGWDGTQAGRGLYYLRTRMGGSTMAGNVGDHWLQWQNQVPANGCSDHWAGANPRKMLIQFALKGGSGAVGPGPLMGMGDTTATNSQGPLPWMITSGPTTFDSADHQYYFSFRTTEGGANNVDLYRFFAFGDNSETGWHHYAIWIDLTTNDVSGMCTLAAWKDGVQIAVGRNYGTQRTTSTGTPGLAGFEPSFTAADSLHYRESWRSPFNIGAHAYYSGTCVGANAAIGMNQAGIMNLELGGLRIDCGTCMYQIRSVGDPQLFISTVHGGAAPTDFQRYHDTNGTSTGTLLMLLPMTDPPHDAAKNTDRLISTDFGVYGGYKGYGFFCYEESNSTAGIVTNTTLRDLASKNVANSTAPAIKYGLAFYAQLHNVLAVGGWVGIEMAQGGYDYILENVTATGVDSWIHANGAMLRIGQMGRAAAGKMCLRMDTCNLEVGQVKVSDFNVNATTQCFIGCFNGGNHSYGSSTVIHKLELDVESPGYVGSSAIYVERVGGVGNPTNVFIENLDCTLLGGAPVVLTGADSGLNYGAQNFPAHLTIRGVNQCDGLILKTQGDAWYGTVSDSQSIDQYLENGGGVALVEHAGPNNTGNVRLVGECSALPTATGSAFERGDTLAIRQPGRTAAAYNAGTTYTQGQYITSGGLTYTATDAASNVGHAPPNATYWTPGVVAEWICTARGTIGGTAPVWRPSKVLPN